VGYPNAYDRAYGRTGGNVMVHGVCSSAGCFSMTDEQINDIYAIARDAFRGGQREIQMQSYPFRMTAENLAKYRLDPNIDFWMEIKSGSDHFEVTRTEPPVMVCNKHYVFGATADGPISAAGHCPALHRDDGVEAAVAEKQSKDEAKVAELVASGVKPVRTVYADGGQNPVFAGYKDSSDPDALVSGPREIVLEATKPVPAAVKVAVSDAVKRRVEDSHATDQVAAAAPPAPPQEAPQPQPQSQTVALAATTATNVASGVWGASTQNVKKWLHLGGEQATEPVVTAFVPDQPVPLDVPLPPRRDASTVQGEKRVASHGPLPSGKPSSADSSTAPEPATVSPMSGSPPAQ